LLADLPNGASTAALEVGCGVMGWLRALSEWVGPRGSVLGTDVDEKMLAGARQFVQEASLANVTLLKDDLFQSQIPPRSFDLVHARFQIAPLGRAEEQLAAYMRLVRPGGRVVLEDPDLSSWRVNPDSPAIHRLIQLIEQGFRAAGGDFNAGRSLPALLRSVQLQPSVRAHVVALDPGHPYLRLPIQFATSLRPRLQQLLPAGELDELVRQAEAELARPDTWGTTFTLIQAVASAAQS
jgi:SAM-dependent methyltransferase